MARCSHLVIFYFKEKFCVSARVGKSLARYLSSSSDLVEKKYISSYIWHKSFIQTVKCSFFNQIILFIKVFMVRRLRLVSVYFKEKFCVSACISKHHLRV